MHDFDEELRDVKREIVESRALVIKTNNLTNALSADIKSIAKRQQSYERKLSWNSATAYVVFVLVVFTALKFAWDARVDAIKSETSEKTLENERLVVLWRDDVDFWKVLVHELVHLMTRDSDEARVEATAQRLWCALRSASEEAYEAQMRLQIRLTRLNAERVAKTAAGRTPIVDYTFGALWCLEGRCEPGKNVKTMPSGGAADVPYVSTV